MIMVRRKLIKEIQKRGANRKKRTFGEKGD